MMLQVLHSTLVVVGLSLTASTAAAQPAAPPAAPEEKALAVQVLDTVWGEVTVIRDNNRDINEKIKAQQRLEIYTKAAEKVLSNRPEMVEMARTIYSQSTNSLRLQQQKQTGEIKRVEGIIQVTDNGISTGGIPVPEGLLEQIGRKRQEIKNVFQREKAQAGINDTVIGKAWEDKNRYVGPRLADPLASTGGKPLLVAKPYLPSGNLERNEVATGYYLIINNDTNKPHRGTLSATITTANGTVNGNRNVTISVPVPAGDYVLVPLVFQRTGDGIVTCQSSFVQDKE